MLCRLLLVCLVLSSAAYAELSLPAVFADHMVIQRNRVVRVFGKDNPGQRVWVRLHNRSGTTVADAEGKWSVLLEPLKAGGPYELSVRGSSSKTLSDVLVGEVWLCSGQSNMQWNVTNSTNGAAEVAAADHPQIRLLHVPPTPALTPQSDIAKAAWRVCTPQSVAYFSAVAYFFGRELHDELEVPIGLIAASSGGTRAEAWTPREYLTQLPGMRAMLELKDMPEQQAWEKHNSELALWLGEMGLSNVGPDARHLAWSQLQFDDTSWGTMKLPAMWQNEGLRQNGVVWFRRSIDIPDSVDLSGTATLHLGTIDDFDIAYVNGERVGSVGGDSPAFWSIRRQYTIPAGVLRHGANVIAVRVMDVGGNGGFGGPAAEMNLAIGNAATTLAGEWRYAVEKPITLDPGRPRPPVPGLHGQATEFYNGMVHPLVPFSIAGVIWYQGESNTRSADAYRQLLRAMIDAWRDRFGYPLPFLIVQLAGKGKYPDEPGDVTDMVEFRDVQRQVVASTPGTALATAIDLGDEDVHPRNKQAVGKRLALRALRQVYGRGMTSSGPTIKSARRDGDEIVLRFENVARGLKASDGSLEKNFAIRSADGTWTWAEARIRGDRVILSGPLAAGATRVRYAWEDRPRAGLYNSEELPAFPFEVPVR